MKRLTALLMVCVLLLCCVSAMAEKVTVFNASVVVPETMTEDELTREDIDDDMVAYYYNDDLQMVIYAYDCEDYDLQRLLELCRVEDAEGLLDSGTTEINGIAAIYLVYSEAFEDVVITEVYYIILQEGMFVEYEFAMVDTAANEQVLAIMNSLTVN